MIKIAEKKHLEDSMSQDPEVGGSVDMCLHVLSKPTWNVGCIHQDIILDDDKEHQSVKEAWEHEDDEDELKIETARSRKTF